MDTHTLLTKAECSVSPSSNGLERCGGDAPPRALLVACIDPLLDTPFLAALQDAPALVWRTPGPVIPPLGSKHRDIADIIEEAVGTLGVNEVAVCGHLPATMLKQLMEGSHDGEAGAQTHLQIYASASRRLAESKHPNLSPPDFWRVIVQEHVLLQLVHLQTYPAVKAKLDQGTLTMHAFVFDVQHGRLYSHFRRRPSLLESIFRSSGSAAPARPFLDPCEIYLA